VSEANGVEGSLPTPPASRFSYGRLLRNALAALLVIAAGLAVEWSWGTMRRSRQATGAAEWIWRGHLTRWSGPKAFYAVRDFDLTEVPANARIVTMGDEEYVLFVNGERVGGNRYTAGAPLDEYDVTTRLAAGTNRLTAHLRSSRAEGAFLLALYLDGEREPALVSSQDWTIVRRFNRRLQRAWIPIERGEQPAVIARPPEGRWGATREARPRPLLADIALLRRGVRPGRVLGEETGWRSMAAAVRGRGGQRLGADAVMLDWGEELTGIVTLRFADGAEAPLGLAYFGEHTPEPVLQAPDAFVIGTPGQTYWEDAVPRRFRYLLLVGLEDLLDARLLVTDATRLEPVPGGQPPPGVLGEPAPRLRTPAEDKIWSELESFPRGAEW
jgi:hypothetical protein